MSVVLDGFTSFRVDINTKKFILTLVLHCCAHGISLACVVMETWKNLKVATVFHNLACVCSVVQKRAQPF